MGVWLTLDEAVVYTAHPATSLLVAAKVGTLRAGKIGRSDDGYRFQPAWLDEWLDAGAVVGSQARPARPDPLLGPTGPSAPGWVYFLATADDRHVKIGWTRSLQQRTADLQCAHPEPLRLVGYLRAGRQRERVWHRRFAAIRTRGEWFVLTDDLRAAIAAVAMSPSALPANPDEPSG